MWGEIAAAVAPSVIGGLMGGGSDGGAGRVAAVSREDAIAASEMAKFKPYAITSGFGKSMFDTDAQTATYELDPTLKAYRDQLYGLGQQGIAGINLDPTQAAQAYYDQQQGLMAGGRTAQDIALRQQQLQQGRIGLGLSGASQGAGAGTGYVNPEQYQRDLARAQADAQLSVDVNQLARQQLNEDIARATGLFDTGFGVEKLGQSALTMGADIGSAAANANANAAKLFLGGTGASNEMQLGANAAKGNFYGSLGESLGGLFTSENIANATSDPLGSFIKLKGF